MPGYQVNIVARAYRVIKKLPKDIQEQIKLESKPLTTDPYTTGKKLEGALSSYWSLRFQYKGTSYRIVYTVVPAKNEVLIYYAGKRENLYKILQRVKA